MTPTRWLIRDGAKLAVYGGGNSGPPLVFQHGLCGDAYQIGEVMQGLGNQQWRGLECRGHGASDMGNVSIATFADDVAALIETMDAPVVVGGISMGAAIATRLAVTRPELVRALVLVRPAWVTSPAPQNMAPNAEVGALLAGQTAAEARAAFSASPTSRRLAKDAPDNFRSLMGFFDRVPQQATARLLSAISVDGPGITVADLMALRQPALVCGTLEDVIHPTARARALAALIPNARQVDLPSKSRDKASHLAALSVAMTQFLKEV
jgi:pimeloyl-ACP methyl ester carboxylesterase